ncbi:DUF2505 domain-containing protein [Nocardioides anomalus]|uniref:DUF2505 domain-containing protein n=1 Tax=Nocardioides anomalus TaxID=2712223 RepID=A0A6G6WFT9_9ACTN|nr:DUF2505 domain-containing protein [Nocardioides anomalus]QIG44211.1 DUF2505 domain-containing protein [Nocardioides anomalus]
MDLRHELSYDAAPARVFAMLADPDFRRAACAAQDVVSADVELERDGEGFRLTVDQVQRTTDLPSFARTFAGETTRAVQREVWLGPDAGSLSIEAPGTPTDVTGTIRLEPSGTGTTEVVELSLKVKVPLLGGRLEKLLAERIRAGMDAEHAVGTAWLEQP